jgi:hypothetical protein
VAKEPKHHYIPVFYLRQWTGDDGRLCEFSKPYDRVKPRRVAPDGTAYVRGLNTIPDMAPEDADFLETYFFKKTDDDAARALRILLAERPWKFTDKERSGWSRFITSLITRNPEEIERLKTAGQTLFDKALPEIEADYAARREPTDPPTYAEYVAIHSPNPRGRAGAILVQGVIDHPMIGTKINNMRWMVLHDARPKNLLLTSDRPVVMTNGLDAGNSQLILPISPKHVFVATNNPRTSSLLHKLPLGRRKRYGVIDNRSPARGRRWPAEAFLRLRAAGELRQCRTRPWASFERLGAGVLRHPQARPCGQRGSGRLMCRG